MKRSQSRSVAWATSALLLLLAAPASAQDCPAQVEHPGEALVLRGDPGQWFHREVARCLLADVEELRLLRQRVGLMDERLRIRDEQLAAMREAVDLSIQAEQRSSGALEAAVRRAREAEEDRDAWHRSPLLWGAVGLASGFALVALGAYVAGAI